MSTSRTGVSGTVLLCLLHFALTTPLWNPQGIGRNIRHLPCVSRKTGEAGTCMFAFSCAKANGTHLGTCIDRFYFGSCCKIPDIDLDLAPQIDDNHLGDDDGTTTPRIRPAITQKPQKVHSSTKPTVNTRPSTTVRPQSSSKPTSSSSIRPPSSSARPPPSSSSRPQSSSSRPQSSSQKPQSSSQKPQSSSSKPQPSSPKPQSSSQKPHPSSPRPQVTNSRPQPSSPRPPSVNSSRPQPSSSRPVTSSNGKPLKPSEQTTPLPTLVTWTTLEESTSHRPVRPQVSSPSPATHKPILPQQTLSPTKRPSITPAPTRPSSTHKPDTNQHSTTKPNTTPIVKPAPSTARPSIPSTKPPSTTWIPVSVSTHAPSPQTTKKPVTKKPISVSTLKPSTATQTTVTVIEVSSTGKPQQSSSPKPASSQKPSPTTARPGIISTISQKPISTTSKPVTKPPRPSSSTVKPVSSSSTQRPETSTASRPVVISTTSKPASSTSITRPPFISSTTERPTTSGSTVRPGISSAKPPVSKPPTVTTTNEQPSVVLIGSSTALPAIQTSVTQQSSSSSPSPATSPTPTTLLPETNEVESFNKTNYKEVCGRRLYPEARIVGGQVSGFGKWPWQISLRQWRTSTFLHKCGAALLNENWAITAAHCVENVPPSDLLLRLGEHDLSTEEEPYGYEERRVQIVASHPQFDPRTFEYDLALLRFYEPVTFQPNIIPVCVPEDDTNFVGSTAFVTGWGRLYEDGPLPSILQEVSVPVINNTLCETMYRAAGYIEHIPDIFICAGWKKGGFDSCEGDSGGPMVIQRTDRRWLLAGVISWGIGCAEPNQPGVYTRISQFRHWINQILQF